MAKEIPKYDTLTNGHLLMNQDSACNSVLIKGHNPPWFCEKCAKKLPWAEQQIAGI